MHEAEHYRAHLTEEERVTYDALLSGRSVDGELPAPVMVPPRAFVNEVAFTLTPNRRTHVYRGPSDNTGEGK